MMRDRQAKGQSEVGERQTGRRKERMRDRADEGQGEADADRVDERQTGRRTEQMRNRADRMRNRDLLE